ncbi:MAG: efflux transporter outer membrane subunit, partial [Chromatiales bacterium]|nr:efflux transporter outer membrane subunit [Chromatiales bacterium]
MMRCCLVVLAALGAGCSVGPDYRAPEPVATGWAGSDDAANETAAYDPQWWHSFGDPVLDRLVTRAAADNLELAAAAARVRQARAQRRAARSTLFPSIGGEASYTNYQLSKNGPGITGDAVEQGLTERDDSFYTAGFDAAYEIDMFGGNRRRRESAAAGEQLALERRRGVMLTVVAEVAREYMELRGAQKRLAITEKNAALQRDLTALVERKYRAGLSRELDVVRARSQTRVVEALVPALRSQIRGSAYRLGVLTGQPPEALLEELLTSTPIPGAPEIVPVGLRSELLRRRPDVRAAERALAQASAEIGVATAEMFPKFVLAGDVAWESVDRGDWFDEDSQRWSLVPFVDWRIF